jgi:3-oxoadipate enol-lactonase
VLIEARDTRFQYDLVGPEDGPAVCCVHALGADFGLWAEQIAALTAAGFRVLRPDLRGHGGSLATPGAYTMDMLADDIAAIAEALQIARLHYVGTSLGGIVGQAFALRHADRLASLFLSDTLPKSPPGDLWAQRSKMVSEQKSVQSLVAPTLERWFSDDFRQKRPGRWQQLHDTMAATDPTGFVGCVEALRNFDFTAQHGRIGTPTLVVCGSDDTGTPPEVNRLIANAIRGAHYHEIAGARHCPNVEFADVYNRLLLDWLAARS